MGLFFDSSKPHVSRDEFKKKVLPGLSSELSHKERKHLEGLFEGDYNEPGREKGVDKLEIENKMKWLRENKRHHSFSDQEIDKIEEVMKRHL